MFETEMEFLKIGTMNFEPRQSDEYSEPQIDAAHRVLMDLGQVLAQYKDCLVLVGGWIPDLLLPEADVPHTGSIDIDLALDAEKRMNRFRGFFT